MSDPGSDFTDVATWAAAAHPSRSRARRGVEPRPGAPYVPSRQDSVIAVVLAAVLAGLLAGLLYWGWLERRAEARYEAPDTTEETYPWSN